MIYLKKISKKINKYIKNKSERENNKLISVLKKLY